MSFETLTYVSEIEANVNELPTVDPPAGLISEDFTNYVAVDSNIQLDIDNTDEELCAACRHQVSELPTMITGENSTK